MVDRNEISTGYEWPPGHYSDGWLPLHQARHEPGQRNAVQHGAHAFGDRHLDLQAAGEITEDGGGGQALDNHADLRECLGRGGALRDQLAGATVATRPRPARDDQVSHPGEARERLGPRAGGLGEPAHLGESARDERRLRVVTQSEPVGAARGERDHVLRSGTELDPDDIVVHVDPERRRRDCQLNLDGERVIESRDHGGRRETTRDLLCDVRSREHGHRPIGDEGREPIARGRVETLRQAEDRAGTRERSDRRAERGARHRDDREVRSGDRSLRDRRRGDARQVDVRKVPRVAARFDDRVGVLGIPAREGHLVAAIAEHDRERGSPRAGPDHGHSHGYSLFTKSIETGTPSSSKRLRSSFSTQ